VECITAGHCSGGKLCYNNQCTPCNPGEKQCQGNEQVIQCKDDGSGFDILEVCPAGATCGNGQCLACYPGTKECDGNQSVLCKPDGSGYELLEDCEATGGQCMLGVCLSPCSGDLKANTNVGCGFFAVDLDNAVDSSPNGTVDAQNAQFAVSASNTSSAASAKVTVYLPDGTTQEKTVAPLSLETFKLPASNSIEGTGRTTSSYRIESTGPITLYQFNPLDNEDVFSNDASVLLPAASVGKEYFAMTREELGEPFNVKFRGYVTIVGTTTTETSVTVTPTARTLAGGEFPSLAAGQSYQFTIKRGEVVNIESDDGGNGDLTGTHIMAAGPVAVFSGHEAAVTGDKCCADHLEQQLVPVAAWGTEYIAASTYKRWAEKDYYRILAAENGTTVTINPAVNGNPILTINKGQFVEFQSDEHFSITSDKPISVAQFLASSQEIVPTMGQFGGTCVSAADCQGGYQCGLDQFGFGYVCQPPQCTTTAQCPQGHTCVSYELLPGLPGDSYCETIGDPAMILLVPTNQWRKEYVFLTPNSYLDDYINIVADPGTTVTLDGAALSQGGFQAVPGSTYRVYRTKVADGVHTITATGGNVSVIVYGYDDDVSYGYPGGVGLGGQ